MRDYLGKRALRMRLPLLVETELVCSTDFQFGVYSLICLPRLGLRVVSLIIAPCISSVTLSPYSSLFSCRTLLSRFFTKHGPYAVAKYSPRGG